MPALFQRFHPSPLGRLRLVADDEALVGLYFPDAPDGPDGPDDRHGRGPDVRDGDGHPVLALAARELDEYLAGARRTFTTPLSPRGTDFQRAVWREILRIPWGETRTYGQIARAIERPSAVRAVGAANGQNPISILVPCHRVIGADGTLTGYGGGLPAKRWLLQHEGHEGHEGHRARQQLLDLR